MLTLCQAADALNASTAHVKGLQQGLIAHHGEGSCLRIYRDSMLAYKARNDQERQAVLDELAVTPEPEDYTPERVRELLAEDAMPPGLRARAAARSKGKPEGDGAAAPQLKIHQSSRATGRNSPSVTVHSAVTIAAVCVQHARCATLRRKPRGIAAPGLEPVMNLGYEPRKRKWPAMTSVRGPRTFLATRALAAISPSSTAPGKPGQGEMRPGRTLPDPPPALKTGLE